MKRSLSCLSLLIPLACLEACSKDTSEPTSEIEMGGGGAGQSNTESGGSAASGGGSEATGGKASGGSTSSNTGGAASGNQCGPVEDCTWNELDKSSCEVGDCCGDMSCVDAICIALCGETADSLTAFDSDFNVLAQICNFQATHSLVQSEASCQQPLIYNYSSSFNEAMSQVEIAVTRSRLSPFGEGQESLQVYERTLPWNGGGVPSAPPANFGVNPSETRLAYWVTDTQSVSNSTFYEVDLKTDVVRNLTGIYPGKTVWLDDTRLLQCAQQIGSDDAGIYVIDVSGVDLEVTLVASGISCGGPLGIIDGTVVLTGGPPTSTPTAALGVIPVAVIEEVVAGTRPVVDIYSDGDIQRFPRGEVWRHFGTVEGGKWFVAPSVSDYSAYQVEELSLSGNALTFGEPVPLPQGDAPYAQAFHVGGDQFAVVTGENATVVSLKP